MNTIDPQNLTEEDFVELELLAEMWRMEKLAELALANEAERELSEL
jgi:hypothetical protein